jgi:hypothetical protein
MPMKGAAQLSLLFHSEKVPNLFPDGHISHLVYENVTMPWTLNHSKVQLKDPKRQHCKKVHFESDLYKCF